MYGIMEKSIKKDISNKIECVDDVWSKCRRIFKIHRK